MTQAGAITPIVLSPRKLEVLRLAAQGEAGGLHPHGARSRRTGSYLGPTIWCRIKTLEAGDGHERRCDRIPWTAIRALSYRGLLTPARRFGNDPQSWKYELTAAGRDYLERAR